MSIETLIFIIIWSYPPCMKINTSNSFNLTPIVATGSSIVKAISKPRYNIV